MGLFEHWPYVNFHDLNLDWIIKEIPKVFASRDEAQASAEASAESAAASQLSADASQTSAENSQQYSNDSQEAAAASASSADNAAESEAAAKQYADNIADPVAGLVTSWLDEHVTPTTPIVDDTLSISGAAADAKATGDRIDDLNRSFAQDIKNTVGFLNENIYTGDITYSDLNGGTHNTELTNASATTSENGIEVTATDTSFRIGTNGRDADNYNLYGFGCPIICDDLSKLLFLVDCSPNTLASVVVYVNFWDSTGAFISTSSAHTQREFTVDVPNNAYVCSLRINGNGSVANNTYTLSIKCYDADVYKPDIYSELTKLEFVNIIPYSTNNGYIDSAGNVVAASDDKLEEYSDFIPVHTGDTLHFSITNSESVSQWVALIQYNSQLEFISRTTLINATQSSFETDITIPSGTAYIVITYRTYGTAEALLESTNAYRIRYDTLSENDNMPLQNYLVKGVNHRGYNYIAPENTIPAFRLSKKRGFSYVETDISVTSDGVFVLLHDASINRTARNADGTPISGTVNISDITYDQALTYDFGIYKGEQYAGTKIPTLEEFMVFCKKASLIPYVELKSTATYTQEQVTAMVNIAKRYGMLRNTTWISFSIEYLGYVLNADQYARVGYIADGSLAAKAAEAVALKTEYNDVFLDAYAQYLTESIITYCVNNGLPVEVWTVNKTTEIISLDTYISGVTTDYAEIGKIMVLSA